MHAIGPPENFYRIDLTRARTPPSKVAAASRSAAEQAKTPITPAKIGQPADFLISSAGRILAASYGTHAADGWSVDDVLRAAQVPPC